MGEREGESESRGVGESEIFLPSPFLVLVLLLVSVSDGAAQAACDAVTLDSAADTYDFGRLDRTVALLQPCLPDGFSAKDQRVSAYRLMALSYLARDSVEQARASIRQLLKVDSRFKPNPQADPRLFTDMVGDLKPRWYSWLWRGNAWYKWAGRAVVVGGVASLPFLLRGNTEPDLPLHPKFPSGR